jgi:hypothetical protein
MERIDDSQDRAGFCIDFLDLEQLKRCTSYYHTGRSRALIVRHQLPVVLPHDYPIDVGFSSHTNAFENPGIFAGCDCIDVESKTLR